MIEPDICKGSQQATKSASSNVIEVLPSSHRRNSSTGFIATELSTSGNPTHTVLGFRSKKPPRNRIITRTMLWGQGQETNHRSSQVYVAGLNKRCRLHRTCLSCLYEDFLSNAAGERWDRAQVLLRTAMLSSGSIGMLTRRTQESKSLTPDSRSTLEK